MAVLLMSLILNEQWLERNNILPQNVPFNFLAPKEKNAYFIILKIVYLHHRKYLPWEIRTKGTTIYWFVSMKLSVMFQAYLCHFNILRVQGKNLCEDYPEGTLNFSESREFRPPCRHVCIDGCIHFSSQVRVLKFICMHGIPNAGNSKSCECSLLRASCS